MKKPNKKILFEKIEQLEKRIVEINLHAEELSNCIFYIKMIIENELCEHEFIRKYDTSDSFGYSHQCRKCDAFNSDDSEWTYKDK
jgi:hypothetical protein